MRMINPRMIEIQEEGKVIKTQTIGYRDIPCGIPAAQVRYQMQ